jgi:hypothetical protein
MSLVIDVYEAYNHLLLLCAASAQVASTPTIVLGFASGFMVLIAGVEVIFTTYNFFKEMQEYRNAYKP